MFQKINQVIKLSCIDNQNIYSLLKVQDSGLHVIVQH